MQTRERPSLAEQHANRCVHFNGIQNDKCLAGLSYPSDYRNLPCRKSTGLLCVKQVFPTPEEVAQFVKEVNEQVEGMRKAFVLVAKIKKDHKGESWSGVEVCPKCGGKLHMSHAKLNGHVWGKCETENCLGWME